MSIAVAVCTYGSDDWRRRGDEALASVVGADETFRVHLTTGTLAESRNVVLNTVRTDRIVFLDADDRLDDGYLDAMRTVTADIGVPWIQDHGQEPRRPRVYPHEHDCGPGCLIIGNYIVIGACARVDMLRSVGGFQAWPVLEDWALWLTCYRSGATFELAPQARYMIGPRNEQARNLATPLDERRAVARRIRETA